MSSRRFSALKSQVPTAIGKAKEVGSALIFEIVFAASLVVIFPITIRGLGPERYGEYTTIYVIAGFAITWVYSGGAAAIVQLILQRHRATLSVLERGRRQVTLLAVPTGLVGLILTALVLGDHLWLPALLIFGSDLLIVGWAEVHLAIIFAHLGIGAVTRIRVWGPVVRAGGVALLGFTGNVTLLNLVLVNLTSSVTLLALSILAMRRLVRDARRDEDEQGRAPTSAGELARLSTLYSTSMSTNAVQNEGEKFILAAARPTSEVGEYQAAYRIVSVALIPLRAVQAAATRWFLPPDDRPRGHVRKAMILSVPSAAYGLVCAVGVVVGQPVIRWVLGSEFETAASITLWLAAMPLLHALAEVPPLGLLGLGRNRLRTYLGLGAAAAAVVAYVALIPPLGWRGAVIGTYISEGVTISAGWWLLLRSQREADRLRAGTTT